MSTSKRVRAQAGVAASRRPTYLLTSYDRDVHPVEFGRILALSDGVFAIALTLLVLDLALPAVTGQVELGEALIGMQGSFFAFAISVIVVGVFHGMHHRLFSLFQRVDGLLWLMNTFYLGLVVLIPFFQRVLSEYSSDPFAYAIFAAVFGIISVIDAVMLFYAHRARLLKSPFARRHAHIEVYCGVMPVAAFLASMPFAYLVGGWTVLLWLAIPLVDGYLRGLEQRGD